MSFEEFQSVEYMVEDENEDKNNNNYFSYNRNNHFWAREPSFQGFNEQNYEDQAATSYHYWTSEKNDRKDSAYLFNFNSSKSGSQVSETSFSSGFLKKSNLNVNLFENYRNQFPEKTKNSHECQSIGSPFLDDDQTISSTSEFKAQVKPIKNLSEILARKSLNEKVIEGLDYNNEQFRPSSKNRSQQPLDTENFNNNCNSLCLIYQNHKLGCAFYDFDKKCLFYLNDLPESNMYELTDLIIADVEPLNIITSAKCDLKFINHLKKKCTLPNAKDQKSNSGKVSKNNSDSEESDNSDKEPDDEEATAVKTTRPKIAFVLLPNNDFNYELSKLRIFQIDSLEDMPNNLVDSEKHIFFSCLFNFDSALAIRSIGALLKFLDQNSMIYDMDKQNTVMQIYSVKPLELDQMCFLDTSTFKALQIFNDIDYVYTYRHSTNRTSLNNIPTVENITLYSLFLSKLHTKVGIAKLRSFMMKPTRNLEILKERHKVVEFFYDSHNHEMTGLVKIALKKCKFVNSILKRMRETRCQISEWKRVYKTTQSLLAVCNLATPINQMMNGDANQTISDEQSVISSVNPTWQHSRNSSDFQARANSLKSNTSVTSKMSSFYSMQANDSRKNLFKRIVSCRYGPRFEYLLNLFESTVNIKESIQDNRCRINPNISKTLDDKKQIFARLSEYLTHVGTEELHKYDLESCNVMYIPQMGFLFVITSGSFLKTSASNSTVYHSNYSGMNENSSLMMDVGEEAVTLGNHEKRTAASSSADEENEELAQIRMEFEFLHELKFVFKSNGLFYYKNERMQELDQEFGDISSDIIDLEAEIMDQIQDEFMKFSHYYANMIDLCSELDTLLAFAAVAKDHNYVKPKYGPRDDSSSFFHVENGRHPLAEIFTEGFMFIPNDIDSGNTESSDSKKVKVITSPNASGKTIYLKQTGLIVYMSMIGSFVPASEALIGDIDRICACINSNDSIVEGQSTFSTDVQRIVFALNSTTAKSLVLIDEFGKGTLVNDGQAILATIIKNWIMMSDSGSPHVFISTHFYEMFQKADQLFAEFAKGIEYLTFDFLFDEESVQEMDNMFNKKIIFLYKLRKGLTKSSYAINMARYIGLDQTVIDRASVLLKLMNEKAETDEDVIDDTKEPVSEFDLLRTDENMAEFNHCKDSVKNIFSLYMEIKEKVSKQNPQHNDNFPTEESILQFKWNNYKTLMRYINSLTRKETDPNNPVNKARKTTSYSGSSKSSTKSESPSVTTGSQETLKKEPTQQSGKQTSKATSITESEVLNSSLLESEYNVYTPVKGPAKESLSSRLANLENEETTRLARNNSI